MTIIYNHFECLQIQNTPKLVSTQYIDKDVNLHKRLEVSNRQITFIINDYYIGNVIKIQLYLIILRPSYINESISHVTLVIWICVESRRHNHPPSIIRYALNNEIHILMFCQRTHVYNKLSIVIRSVLLNDHNYIITPCITFKPAHVTVGVQHIFSSFVSMPTYTIWI